MNVLHYYPLSYGVPVRERYGSTLLPATRERLKAGNIVGGVHYTTSCNTQSSAPEDGQNNFPKHAELTGIINKPLLLHLVGCLYYLYQ